MGDLFNSLMAPLHWAISLLLMYAYKGWSWLIGADLGLTWALSIMTLTVIVRTILIPLFIRQINSARNMQLIQPKMKELQDKYSADRQKLGVETQKLMKQEGVSPWSSCFPMLLQMPVFFALYQVLYGAAQGTPRGYWFTHNLELVDSLKHARFLGGELAGRFWLSDWSQFGATQIMAMVLVLLMTGMLFITQKQLMSKNMSASSQTGPMAQQQKMMLYMFPIMYLFMGALIPVGVLVYWVTNNLWTLVQQWLLIRNNPTPDTPAYIEWEERMIKKGLDPEKIAAERRAKRSGRPQQATGSRKVGEVRTPPKDSSGGVRNASTESDRISKPDAPSRQPIGKTDADEQPDNIGSSSVARQQIQRQQPMHQSRSNRSGVKKKK